MEELFHFINEKLWILIVLITPVICFIWYKLRYRFLSDLILPFFIFGIVITVVGVVLSNATVSTTQTINALMLKELHVAGKLIPIGYIFVLFSLIAMVDTVLNRMFKINNDNKT